MPTKIYLAGPIHGCNDEEARGWREAAKRGLPGAQILDPMDRDYRGVEDVDVQQLVEDDLADIGSCDVVLANCWKPSYGTTMELVYAHKMGKRVVVVVPDLGNVSPWVLYHATVVVPKLESGIAAVRYGR